MTKRRTTHFKDIDYLVAYDAGTDAHFYLRGADMIVTGDEVTFIGNAWQGEADEVVDCRRRMVMPGFVNIHTHASAILENKGLLDEVSSKLMGSTVVYEYNRILRMDPAYNVAKLNAALYDLARSGSTTVVDLAYAYPGWIETLAASGLRTCAGAQFVDALHWSPDGHTMTYQWDLPAGQKAMRESMDAVDAALNHPSGRLFALIAPGQVDTCTPELLRDSRIEADRRGVALTTHASQSAVEFREMVHRHGLTPIEWLHSIGFLGPRTTIGHAIFLDQHPWLHWPHQRDLAIMRETGTHVAHCPWVQATNGRTLQSFRRYRELGVNVGLGTDGIPLNMPEEMRWALVCGRIAEGVKQAVTTSDVLYAATIGGARALGREDIGRLCHGAKADLLVVDLDHPTMRPVRDPVRTLIFVGLERPIRDVWVGGIRVVADFEVLTIVGTAAHLQLQEGYDAMLPKVPSLDYAKRTVDEAFPLSLPVRNHLPEPKRAS